MLNKMIELMPERRKEGRMQEREGGKNENIRESREATFTQEEMLELPASLRSREGQTGSVPGNDRHKGTKWPGQHVATKA